MTAIKRNRTGNTYLGTDRRYKVLREDGTTVYTGIDKIMAFAAAMERGDILIKSADWNKDWIQELIAAPLGLHDDQCDSVSGAYRFLVEGGDQNIYFF